MLSLECSCCSGQAYANKQWYNRDNGYGLCPTCAVKLREEYNPETMKNYYGIRGIHYFINTPPDSFHDWLIFESSNKESHLKAYEILKYSSGAWPIYLEKFFNNPIYWIPFNKFISKEKGE